MYVLFCVPCCLTVASGRERGARFWMASKKQLPPQVLHPQPQHQHPPQQPVSTETIRYSISLYKFLSQTVCVCVCGCLIDLIDCRLFFLCGFGVASVWVVAFSFCVALVWLLCGYAFEQCFCIMLNAGRVCVAFLSVWLWCGFSGGCCLFFVCGFGVASLWACMCTREQCSTAEHCVL